MKKEKIEINLEKVIGKLLNLERPDNEHDFQDMSTIEAEKKGYFSRDFGMDEWDWPQGVGLFGLQRIQEYKGEDIYQSYMQDWLKKQKELVLPLKNINTTAPMLTLMDYPDGEALSLEWMEWLMNELPRTEENGYQHVTTGQTKHELKLHEGQIWLDTIFMAILFTGKMGLKYNRTDWQQESIYQLLLHAKYLHNPKNNLFYHGWDFLNRSQFSDVYWCRGNSWFTLAAPIYLEMMKDVLPDSLKTYIATLFKQQVDQLLVLQGEDGLWHTVLDDSESYTETSGSASIIAGILFAVRKGILPESYLVPCEKAIPSLLERIDEEGTVLGVSGGTPIGYSKEDYKGILIAPMAYGQALMIVALSEALYFAEC